MGIVYEGYDPLIERRVALKTVNEAHFDGTQGEELLNRLRREAQAAGRLSHPNIVAIYEYGEDVVPGADGAQATTAFIAMELVDGRELKSYLDAHERFAIPEIQRLMGELLGALEYSHSRGVVHRDIKPANLILLEGGTLKVADFGIARIESSTLTQLGTVLGSPHYMSPEQFMGQTADGRSDLYSTGVVLYELLTGETPFTGGFTTIMHRVLNDEPPPPSVLNVHVPREFDAILRRALAKRPDERYQSAAEFKQRILEVSPERPVSSAAAGSTQGQTTLIRSGSQTPVQASVNTASPPRSNPAAGLLTRGRGMAVLVAVCAAAVISAASFYLLRGWRPAPPIRAASAEVDSGARPPNMESLRAQPGTVVISALGFADPEDPRYAQDSAALERLAALDARRQLIEKAAALYVDPQSLGEHYQVLRDKLLTRSGEFIAAVLQEERPQRTKDGLLLASVRATVNVRDVQQSLNQLSRDERIEFIRNNGNPQIAVQVRTASSDSRSDAQPRRSEVAENLLKERIRSFGFTIVDEEAGKHRADFRIDSEVRFKRLATTLAASGLTIEKFVPTSWTVKAIDAATGEEVFHDTSIPEGRSWATEELALRDVGRLVGESFSRTFFLEHFASPPRRVRLRFSGAPPAAAKALLSEINATLGVLDATLLRQAGPDVLIEAALTGGSDPIPDLIERTILRPINQKLGETCFTLGDATARTDIPVVVAAACRAGTLGRLELLPPAALMNAPTARLEEVARNPRLLRKTRI
jgi:serine/threonine-protein kinase